MRTTRNKLRTETGGRVRGRISAVPHSSAATNHHELAHELHWGPDVGFLELFFRLGADAGHVCEGHDVLERRALEVGILLRGGGRHGCALLPALPLTS